MKETKFKLLNPKSVTTLKSKARALVDAVKLVVIKLDPKDTSDIACLVRSGYGDVQQGLEKLTKAVEAFKKGE